MAIELTPEEDKVQFPPNVRYQSGVQLDSVLVSGGKVIKGALMSPASLAVV